MCKKVDVAEFPRCDECGSSRTTAIEKANKFPDMTHIDSQFHSATDIGVHPVFAAWQLTSSDYTKYKGQNCLFSNRSLPR
jgi:hypothetical protein